MLQPVSTADSCCTRAWNYLNSPAARQTAKTVFWYGGAVAAAFVPVPYLNGALMGSMLIMGTYELSKHPDSACMQPDLRAKTLNRTWKHLATGTLLSGAGWSLAQLAGGLQVGLPLALGGTVLGLLVVYSDACFAAAPLPGNRQPLVTAAGAPAA